MTDEEFTLELQSLVRELHKRNGNGYLYNSPLHERLKAVRRDSRADAARTATDVMGEAYRILRAFSEMDGDLHAVMTMARRAIASWDGELEAYERRVLAAKFDEMMTREVWSKSLAVLKRIEAGHELCGSEWIKR